jgi:hypothetical protein
MEIIQVARKIMPTIAIFSKSSIENGKAIW